MALLSMIFFHHPPILNPYNSKKSKKEYIFVREKNRVAVIIKKLCQEQWRNVFLASDVNEAYNRKIENDKKTDRSWMINS